MVDCHSEWLTKSFRYGQAVADIATTVLEDAMHIEGNEKIQSAAAQWETVDRSQPYTRLFRTNAALLYAAVEEIAAGTEVSIEIDVKDFVKLLQSAVALYQGDMKGVKHDSLLPYASWDEMVAESTGNAELTRLCRIMKDGLAQRFMDILESHVNSSTPAVTFTTAHKSKGREWEQVTLEDDFKSCYDEEGDWTGLTTEEQNLLYVAVTRAILRLEYNETVQQYINYKESSDLPVNVRKAVMGVIGDSHHGSSFPVGDLRGDMAQFYVQQEMEAYQVESLAGAPWE
jgi:superfamily I DNA/RNA helicase